MGGWVEELCQESAGCTYAVPRWAMTRLAAKLSGLGRLFHSRHSQHRAGITSSVSKDMIHHHEQLVSAGTAAITDTMTTAPSEQAQAQAQAGEIHKQPALNSGCKSASRQKDSTCLHSRAGRVSRASRVGRVQPKFTAACGAALPACPTSHIASNSQP